MSPPRRVLVDRLRLVGACLMALLFWFAARHERWRLLLQPVASSADLFSREGLSNPSLRWLPAEVSAEPEVTTYLTLVDKETERRLITNMEQWHQQRPLNIPCSQLPGIFRSSVCMLEMFRDWPSRQATFRSPDGRGRQVTLPASETEPFEVLSLLQLTDMYVNVIGFPYNRSAIFSAGCHMYWPYDGGFPLQAKPMDEVFLLSGAWGHGHFHFLIEELPRLAAHVQFLREHPRIRIHVNNLYPEGHWMRVLVAEAVELLGIAPSRIVTGTLFSRTVYMQQPGMCGGGYVAAERTLARLVRARMRELYGEPPAPSEATILVIHRKKADSRRILEHDEMMAAIREAFPSREVVVFGDDGPMPLAEQLALFYRAGIVVGPHGGALSNTIAMAPGSHVIEIQKEDEEFKPLLVRTCFQTLSFRLGFQHHYHYPAPIDGPHISVRVGAIVDILRSIHVE